MESAWPVTLRIAAAHVVHLAILLLPSLALRSPDELVDDAPLAAFAFALAISAWLESRFAVTANAEPGSDRHTDVAAMNVAAFVGAALLAGLWIAQVEHHVMSDRPGWLCVTGACLAIAGIALRVTAIRTLGDRFISDIRINAPPVRNGIYAWLSHPSEIGLLLIATGAPLMLGAMVTAGAALCILGPISAWRVRRENLALVRYCINKNSSAPFTVTARSTRNE